MADGTVKIKATLDTSSVKSGVASIQSSVAGISWEGIKNGSVAASSLSSAMQSAGTSITANITTPLVEAAKTSYATASDFDTTMRQLSVATGTPIDQMDSLRQTAEDMGASTIYSTTEAGDAMLEFAKGGLTAAQIQSGALDSSMTLAAAGGLELADASSTIVQGMNMFGISAENSSEVTTALAGAANASTADVSDLAMGLSQCGAQASISGWNLQDTASAMAALSDKGIQGSDAGTSLKTMLQSLVPTTDTAKAAMAEYGLSFTDASGNIDDMQTVAQKLQSQLGGLTEEQKSQALTTIFGSDASRAAAALMGTSAEKMKTYEDATRDSSNATDMASAATDGMAGALSNAGGAINNAEIALGDALAPAVAAVADVVADLANGFTSLDDSTQIMIAGGLAVVAVIGPLLAIGGQLMAMIPSVTAGLEGAGAAAGTVGAGGAAAGTGLGAMLGPIALVVAAIVGVIALMTYLWNTNEAFRTSVTSVLAQVATQFQTMVSQIQAAIAPMAATLSPLIGQLATSLAPVLSVIFSVLGTILTVLMQLVGDSLTQLAPIITTILAVVITVVTYLVGALTPALQQIGTMVSSVMNDIASVVSGALEVVRGVFDVVVGFIVGLVTGDFTQMGSGVTEIMNGLSDVLSGILNGISDVFSGVLNTISSLVSGIFSGISNAISDAMGGAKNTVTDALDAIAGFFSNLHLELPHINLPHFTISGSFNLDPANFSVPSLGIDWYAKGGVFSGPSVIGVGEAGPEAVAPIDKLQAYIDEAVSRSSNGSSNMSEEGIGAAVAAALKEMLSSVKTVRIDKIVIDGSKMSSADYDGLIGSIQQAARMVG